MSLCLTNLIGFGAGNIDSTPVSFVDGGDVAPTSGGGTTTHTYNSLTTSGPDTAYLITAERSTAGTTLNSVVHNGNPATKMVEHLSTLGGRNHYAAVWVVRGSQTGNLVLTFSANADDSQLTVVDVTGLQSLTPVDTDTIQANSAGSTLTALNNPGASGGVLAAIHFGSDTATQTWTNATEIADLNMGNDRHSAAWVVGNPAGNISTTSGGADFHVLVAAAIR